MKFEEVAGHAGLKHKLIETVKHKRISHSQLFFGPEGNGSLPLAQAYAQYILCENPSDTDSCGQCAPCRQVQSFNYPDLHYVYPVSKIGDKVFCTDFLDDWKSLLKDEKYFGLFRWFEKLGIENKQAIINVKEGEQIMKKLSLKSYAGDYKVLIFWMPERMHNAAANKLLKLLEEPSQKTLFLLVAEDPDQLLTTITSRCQKVFVPKYTLAETQEFLESEGALDPAATKVIARLAEGNLSHARGLAERAEIYRDYATLFSHWVRNCYAADVQNIIKWSEECGRFEREKIKNFLSFCSNTFRDSLNITYGNSEATNTLFKEVNFELEKFAKFVHVGNTGKILQGIDDAAYDISRNANPRLVLTDLSLNMARFLRMKA